MSKRDLESIQSQTESSGSEESSSGSGESSSESESENEVDKAKAKVNKGKRIYARTNNRDSTESPQKKEPKEILVDLTSNVSPAKQKQTLYPVGDQNRDMKSFRELKKAEKGSVGTNLADKSKF